MKKLYQLKKWLTLEETAKHLSIVFGEPVCEADILRLGLDHELKISIYFVNGAVAKSGKLVPVEQALMYILPKERGDMPLEKYAENFLTKVHITDKLPQETVDGLLNHALVFSPVGFLIRDNEVLELEKDICHLGKWDEVYDLPLIGAERLDIEHQYQMQSSGVEVTGVYLDGAFVADQHGQFYQILTHFDDNKYANSDEKKRERTKKPLYDLSNYYPAGGLPDDAVLVVRTSELAAFESRISESASVNEKALSTTERNSLLTIIAALCDYSDINYKSRGASTQIENLTEEIGARVSDDTIRKALEKIPNALEARMK